MTWKVRPAHFNLRFVRAVRKALAKGEDCCGLAVQTYHLFVRAPEAERSELYTVCLVRDDEGTCMAICRELPDVFVFAESEGGVIAAAHTAIEEALAAQDHVSEFQWLTQPLTRSGPSTHHEPLA